VRHAAATAAHNHTHTRVRARAPVAAYAGCARTSATARGEKSHAYTYAWGLISSSGNTLLPAPQPTCARKAVAAGSSTRSTGGVCGRRRAQLPCRPWRTHTCSEPRRSCALSGAPTPQPPHHTIWCACTPCACVAHTHRAHNARISRTSSTVSWPRVSSGNSLSNQCLRQGRHETAGQASGAWGESGGRAPQRTCTPRGVHSCAAPLRSVQHHSTFAMPQNTHAPYPPPPPRAHMLELAHTQAPRHAGMHTRTRTHTHTHTRSRAHTHARTHTCP
jgi:hypothetical protein